MSLLKCILLLIVFILIHSISCSTDATDSTTQSLAHRLAAIGQQLQDEYNKDENQLKIDRDELEKEKRISNSIDHTHVLQLNVGGEIMTTTRQTLTKIPKSILSLLFYGRWEHKLQRDQEGKIFLDFNSFVFRHLLDQLQIIETNNLINIHPPSQPSLVEPFKKMLRILSLQQLLSSDKKNVITFNVGGQMITNQRSTFTSVSNSTFENIVPLNKQNDVFLDYDPKLFQHLINQLRKESFKSISPFKLSSNEERISFETMLIDLSIFVITTTSTSTTTRASTTKQMNYTSPSISTNTKWKQNGVTIAGGNGANDQLNQLFWPEGIYVDDDDDDQHIYIVDFYNDRIVEWKLGAKVGQTVADRSSAGNRMYQLNQPTDVIVDKKTDSLIICDRGNKRVIRWSRRNGVNGQIIISGIHCYGLRMDKNGDLYVSDTEKNEVRRWNIKEQNGTIVAGGNGRGTQFNQLNQPTYLFVDEDHSVYVSDQWNNRVMKWMKGAKEGIVVAGGQDQGNSFTQLSYPTGVIVDHLGNIYVADSLNHRIMCWSKGSKEGRVILGGKGHGQQLNQFNYPVGLSFDRKGKLYVVDQNNHRVQQFLIDLN